MSVFLIVMIIGMVGLALMAIPGISRGHGVHVSGHGSLHTGHASGGHSTGRVGGPAHTSTNTGAGATSASSHSTDSLVEANMAASLRWFPSPRAAFSIMTLFGGFGYAFETGAHLKEGIAAILAIILAALVERYAVGPAWNSLMQFEGVPSSPLDELTFQDAVAVTAFRNGKGMVTVVRDGRAVQLLAYLREDQASMAVQVGDKLKIEAVDSQHERLTVALN